MRFAAFLLALWPAISPSAFGQAPQAPVPDAQPTEVTGLPARSTPGDSQAHVAAGPITIAADFMGHSVPTADGTYSSEDYVIIETAFFGARDAKLKISYEDFSLRINGRKNPQNSQAYGLVLKTLKDPEWQPPKAPEKSKTSFGGGGGEDSSAPPPKMPFEMRRAIALKVTKVSLPGGERALPQGGLIFFEYRGKVESIHSIELIYDGPAGKATLSLQP